MTKTNSETNELITFKNSQGISAGGTLLKLSQNFIVFEVYNPYSIVQLSESLSEMKIFRAGKEIYNGKAVVTNIVNTGILLIVSAVLYDEHWKYSSNINSNSEIQDEIKHLISNFELHQEIAIDFKISILSMRSFLSELKSWIDKLEPQIEKAKIKVNKNFILDSFETLFQKMTHIYSDFQKSSERIPKNNVNFCKKFLQNQLHPFLMPSPFLYRTYTKPLGYAGDYEMMNMIQRENAEGPNLYAKFINVFYTNIPIANSVKNRTDNLIRLIEEGVKKAESENRDFYSLTIGCGPALEIKEFLRKNTPKIKCHFKLLDFNEETLNFATSNVIKAGHGKLCEITSELNSVHELLKRSVYRDREENKYDLVYCSGLFDYLSDKICTRLIKLFFSMIRNGGKVLITNMHSNDKDRYMMELLTEWYLIYRDEDNISSFTPGLGQQKIYTDPTGINLCLEIEKV